MNDVTSVGKRVQSLDIGPEFDVYTRVIIHAGEVEVTDKDSGNTSRQTVDYIADVDMGQRGWNETWPTKGRTMEVSDPMGTQAAANALLARLQDSSFQFQPLKATAALLDPAAEIGDGLSVSDSYSAIYRRDTNFNSLMDSDVEAPSDEEIEHEFPYIPKAEREYKREVLFTRTQLKMNADGISAEVSRASEAEGNLSSRINVNANAITTEVNRATGAEGNLSSRITQNASSISAEVTRATNAEGTKLNHTRSNSSFGWKLTADGFYLNASGSKNVFTCTKDGIIIQGNATVTGKIQATSGFIGQNATNGFTISNSAIYNPTTKNSLNADTVDGIYIGKDGIALGKGTFKVTRAGAVTANNLTLTGGSITLGKDSNGNTMFQVTSGGAVTARSLTLSNGLSIGSNFTVSSGGDVTANNMNLKGTLHFLNSKGEEVRSMTAADLSLGAYRANDKYSNWNSAYNSTSYGGYCYTGATYGSNYNKATEEWTYNVPNMFSARNIRAINMLIVGERSVAWRQASVTNSAGGTMTITYLGEPL